MLSDAASRVTRARTRTSPLIKEYPYDRSSQPCPQHPVLDPSRRLPRHQRLRRLARRHHARHHVDRADRGHRDPGRCLRRPGVGDRRRHPDRDRHPRTRAGSRARRRSARSFPSPTSRSSRRWTGPTRTSPRTPSHASPEPAVVAEPVVEEHRRRGAISADPRTRSSRRSRRDHPKRRERCSAFAHARRLDARRAVQSPTSRRCRPSRETARARSSPGSPASVAGRVRTAGAGRSRSRRTAASDT